MQPQPKSRLSWIWPLVLIIIGFVLLLDNFLLLDIDVSAYWPALLVLLGLQLLLRGDIAPSWQAQTFGITRGSVEAGSIEIESGEVDVQLRALRKPGRLIAGQYTARSRPGLRVRNNRATLQMQRGRTWMFSMADWDIGLAHDLPWDLLVSSYLGRLELDLRGLRIHRAYVSSGLGSVNLACPSRLYGPLIGRSTFGDVRIIIPEDTPARITVKTGPFGRTRVDTQRFTEVSPGIYESTTLTHSTEAEALNQSPMNITASTVFGSVYIA